MRPWGVPRRVHSRPEGHLPRVPSRYLRGREVPPLASLALGANQLSRTAPTGMLIFVCPTQRSRNPLPDSVSASTTCTSLLVCPTSSLPHNRTHTLVTPSHPLQQGLALQLHHLRIPLRQQHVHFRLRRLLTGQLPPLRRLPCRDVLRVPCNI
jgi:hypothetical protein